MCLNRYYIAEGVKLYSQARVCSLGAWGVCGGRVVRALAAGGVCPLQDTWKLVVQTRGPAIVASVIADVVTYYIGQAQAENHAVREAACFCIAELAHKVDKAAVAPHVPTLLHCLITCFKDESWPVSTP